MKYGTYIFDFDFTLADATPGIVSSANYALNKLGFESESVDSIRKTVGMTLRDTFAVLTGIPDKQLAEQYSSYFKEMADNVMTDNTALFDDTIEVLSNIKERKYNTAIVTSKFHYRIDEVLKKYNIVELIDYIVGFEDVAVAKPSPDGLKKAIEHFCADKSTVLYVGDSLIDANTAASASVDFVAVTTGTTGVIDFEPLPHVHIAKSLTDLCDFIGCKEYTGGIGQ